MEITAEEQRDGLGIESFRLWHPADLPEFEAFFRSNGQNTALPNNAQRGMTSGE
ncbi:MAG: hypothetical protein GDA36_13760 [Rhodobacteraceae bacterium]|nr:hypothetical protein [Paracoccaceae bacterium]